MLLQPFVPEVNDLGSLVLQVEVGPACWMQLVATIQLVILEKMKTV